MLHPSLLVSRHTLARDERGKPQKAQHSPGASSLGLIDKGTEALLQVHVSRLNEQQHSASLLESCR